MTTRSWCLRAGISLSHFTRFALNRVTWWDSIQDVTTIGTEYFDGFISRRSNYIGYGEVPITETQRITKTYYSAGSTLMAMRVVTSTGGNTLYFLSSDTCTALRAVARKCRCHLGSSSLTTNANGSITLIQLIGNLSTTYTYYPLNFRLKSIQTGALLNLNYAYDPVGNVARITDVMSLPTPLTQIQNFKYDDLDRLTRAISTTNGY